MLIETLKKILLMPFITWIFTGIILILTILTLPLIVIWNLVLQLLPKRASLAEKEIEFIVQQWAAKHKDKISIESSLLHEKKNEFNNSLEMIISPHHKEIEALRLRIGGPVLLYVSIRNDSRVGINYGPDINENELVCLLEAYLYGEYYIINWMMKDKVIDEHLYIKNPQGKYTTDAYDLSLAIKRSLSTKKRINFLPI